ncbi:MAG TPA: secondary thiamine-phosphate synthase enzyme YjbQ [Candidatus Dormibacteraeota bacterium]|nr:secondary thiamine-phosphate synthase enzyme YjbQ [Candidatus Dormibacteraeota bacterium]
MLSRDLRVDTSRRRVVDVTDEAAALARVAGGDGLLNVFVPHATAGVAIMETGSGSEPDLVEALERLLPRDDRYRHHHGSTGHGADHLLPVLVSPSVTVPVRRGRLELGVWQRLVVVDLNPDNPERTLRLSFLREAGG